MFESGDSGIEKIIDRNTNEITGDTAAGGSKSRRKRGGNSSSTGNTEAEAAGESAGVIEQINEIPVLDFPTPETAKKRTRKPKETETNILEENIESLLKVGFQMAAVRFGEHWHITNDESKLVSRPTARIMNRLNMTQAANKYMDYITLTSALAVIVLPRILAGGNNQNESRKIEAVNSEVDSREQKTISVSRDIRNAVDSAIIED